MIAQRSQDDMTLLEMILSMDKEAKMNAIDFVHAISRFTAELVRIQNLQVLQKIIFKGYGPVLLNTPIYSTSSAQQTFEAFLNKSDCEQIKTPIKILTSFEVIKMVHDAFKAIKMGDLNGLIRIFSIDKHCCITQFRDFSGRSLLHLAVLYSRPSIVKYLFLDINFNGRVFPIIKYDN